MKWAEVVEHAKESAFRNHCIVFIHQTFGVKDEQYSWRLFLPVECDGCDRNVSTVAAILPDGSFMNAGAWRATIGDV